MQEHGGNGHRTHEAHTEDIHSPEAVEHGSVVGKLVADGLLRSTPANEYGGEETSEGQKYLTSEEIAEVEDALSENRKSVDGTARQCTHHTDGAAKHSLYPCSGATLHVHLLKDGGRTYLVH